MNLSQTKSKAPFFIVLILLLGITGIQFLFNFRGLQTDAAMDQAQIARNVARGEGLMTHVIRPIQLVGESSKDGLNPFLSDEAIQEKSMVLANQGEKLIDNERFSPLHLRDTRFAPLNILVEALVFKLTGVQNYSMWQMTDDTMIYLPDRIVAGISTAFFILSVLSCYFVLTKLFDTLIATFSCLTMILSNTFLNYAISGLPQMLMLFFFIWGVYFLFKAMRDEAEGGKFLGSIILSSLAFSLVCLTGWIGLWPMAGYLIFLGIRFKPNGLYCIPALIVLGAVLAYPLLMNKATCGRIYGSAFYTITTGIFGSEETIMRSLIFGDTPLGGLATLRTIVNNLTTQISLLYSNLGYLPLALGFFPALLHTFKNPAVNQTKWAVFAMWALATVGMALYTPGKTVMTLGQIQLLFSALFTAYGTAFVLNLIARHPQAVSPILRGAVLLIALLITALPLILSLPNTIRIGILTAHRGIPAWPPYYPLGLNKELRAQTDEHAVVLTDQPEAVSWYSDRKSMFIPKLISQFDTLERVLELHDSKVGSILITPSSSKDQSTHAINDQYGEFAPFILEGAMLLQSKDKDPVYLVEHSPVLEKLTKRFAGPDSRHFIMGAQMVLYTENTQLKQQQKD